MLLELRAVLAPAPFELAYNLLGFPLGLEQHLLGVLLGLLQHHTALLLQLFLQPFGLIADLLGFPMGLLGQLPLALGDLAMIFGVGDHVLKADVLVGQPLVCVLDDLVRQAQLPGNLKGVGLARHPDGQPVGGPEGVHVKLHRGVLHPGLAERIGLELAVMGGGQGGYPHLAQPLQNGHGQRRAFGGIGARAQLVKERQGPRGHVFQNIDDIGHMRGKGGQRLLNALFIANVRVYLVKHRNLRTVIGRDLKPRLGHERQKPHGL